MMRGFDYEAVQAGLRSLLKERAAFKAQLASNTPRS